MAETRMVGSHIKEFRDWRAAAEESLSRKAVSRDALEVVVPPMNNHPAMKLRANLVIEIAGGRMSFVFHSAQGIPIDYLPKPHASDIDRVAWWKPWDWLGPKGARGNTK